MQLQNIQKNQAPPTLQKLMEVNETLNFLSSHFNLDATLKHYHHKRVLISAVSSSNENLQNASINNFPV